MIMPKYIRMKSGFFGSVFTYITLSGDSEAEAQQYLSEQNDIPLFTYICVETPEGTFCKDCKGPYNEKEEIAHRTSKPN